MERYVDISLRLVDPLDEHRLFEFPADAAAAEGLYRRLAPTHAEGRCVIAAPTYYLLAKGAADVQAVNDFVLHQQRLLKQALAAFGVVEPKHQDHAVKELERLAARGAKGVVWSPRAQGVLGDDALMAALCRRAHELGLASMVRTEPYSTNEALWRIWRMASDCPEVPILVTGALQAWDNAQLIASSKSAPLNVLYDTAGWTIATDPLRILDVVGQTRLLFGTAGLGCADEAAAQLQRRLRDGGLCAAATAAVMSGNACGLLGLEASP